MLRKPHLISAMAVAVVSILYVVIYWSTLSLYFTEIDTLPILLTSQIHSIRDVIRIFLQPVMAGRMQDALHYRPTNVLSFGIDYAIWGLNPFGFHLTNLVLGVANVAMVYFVVRNIALLLTRGALSKQQAFGIQAFSFLSALLFALHPMQGIDLPGLARRVEIFSAFFNLATLFFLSGYLLRRRLVNLVFSLASAFLAMGSKEIGATAPLMAIGLLFVVRSADSSWKSVSLFRRALEKPGWYFVCVAVFFAVLRTHVLHGLGGYFIRINETRLWSYIDGFFSLGAFLAAPWLSLKQLGFLLVHAPWFPVVFLVVTIACGWRALRRESMPAKSILGFLLLFPILQMTIFSIGGVNSSDRYMYTASIVCSVAVAGLFVLAIRARSIVGMIATGAWVLSLVLSSPAVGPALGMTDLLKTWKEDNSDITRDLLTRPLPVLRELSASTRIYLVNLPLCAGQGCRQPYVPVLLEHSVQAWLDLVLPEKRFDAVAVNYLEAAAGRSSLSADAKFGVANNELDVVAHEGTTIHLRPWRDEFLTHHTHVGGARHKDLYSPVDASDDAFFPDASERHFRIHDPFPPERIAFLVYDPDGAQLFRLTDWQRKGL